MANHLTPNPSQTTVFYDGSGPLCLAEVGYCESIDNSGSLCRVDVSKPEFAQQDTLPQKTSMERFHVLSSDGRLLSGAPAFIEGWQGLPGWNWLVKIATLPGVISLLELAYRAFLVFRPFMVKLFFFARRVRQG